MGWYPGGARYRAPHGANEIGDDHNQEDNNKYDDKNAVIDFAPKAICG